MPKMSGLQVLEKLREAKYEWPVILMTFHGSESIAVQAFRLGVRDYIRKPFEVEEVLTSVDRVLVESRLRRERQELLKRLENTNRQLKSKVAELSALYKLGQAMTSVLDLDRLLNRIVEAAVFLCRAEEGSLYLIDQESGELYMTAQQGVGERAARGVRLPVNDSLVGQVVAAGKPAIVTSNTVTPGLKIMTGYLVHSLVNIPLLVKGEVIGVLSVANRLRRRDFARDDITRLQGLANYAAIAIQNARLMATTRKLVAAEVLNNAAVTISHYINNPLMALMIGIDRLKEASKEKEPVDWNQRVAETARLTEMKVEEISAVIAILRDLASPQFVTYMDNIKMIDIDAKLKERLRYIKEKYQE
jgi:two-component system NtrC family sensor kinase